VRVIMVICTILAVAFAGIYLTFNIPPVDPSTIRCFGYRTPTAYYITEFPAEIDRGYYVGIDKHFGTIATKVEDTVITRPKCYGQE
jgi:hypothetical protein